MEMCAEVIIFLTVFNGCAASGQLFDANNAL